MKHFIVHSRNFLIVAVLALSYKSLGQTPATSPNDISESFHETLNATGNKITGTAGSATYSIGQVFYTYIGPSVNNAAQGVQNDYLDQTVWNGFNWDNGSPTSSTDAFISGDYNETANINASSLTVDSSAMTTIPTGFNVNLNDALKVNSGSFTLKNNANLIQTFESINSGNITVERESSSLLRLDYTLWSSPVKNETAFLQAFSPSTSTNRFYKYNTSTNLFNAIGNPLNTPFGLGQGYLIRMPNDASSAQRTKYLGQFTGVANNGTITIAMANEGPSKRFNLVGNPYPSPIYMAQFVSDNSANINPTLYFWRKTNGSTGGAYCTWAGGIFVSNNEPEVFDPEGIIQTGQGFFIEALESANTVVFKNTQRIANNANQFFKTRHAERNAIWLNATNMTGAFSQMAVNYNANATKDLDSFDAKYFNDGPIALNSFLDHGAYVIQGRPMPFDTSEILPLSFSATNSGQYTIAIDHVDGLFTTLPEIILKDNDTGIETNLKLAPYNFTAVTGTTNSRFSLKFQKTLGIEISDFDENEIIVYKSHEKISIRSKVSTMKNVKIYDMQGRLLFENTKINSNQTSFSSQNVADQILIVKIRLDNGKLINRKIVSHNSIGEN